jgi:acyl-coenzyme A thioesterase PaaI-like protein
MTLAFQDFYSDDVSHCYGCGRLNEHGYQFKTYWDGDESVTRFQPQPYHTAIPGYVYGGLIASLIDCHSTGTAAAALYRAENRGPDTMPTVRCLTASLHVDYLKPTPLGLELELRGIVKEIVGRRVTVSSILSADGVECVRGEVVAVQVSDNYIQNLIARKSE